MSWITIEHGGKVQRLATARTPDGVWIGWSGRSAFFTGDRKPRLATEAAVAAVHNDVRAPMTGKVVAVKVVPGDRVEVGDLLLVLEAMKMEYRLVAPRAGEIESVHCRAGELVDLGKPLVSLVSLAA